MLAPSRTGLLALLLLAVLVASGCTTPSPAPAAAGTSYQDPAGRFTAQYPSTWQATADPEIVGRADAAFIPPAEADGNYDANIVVTSEKLTDPSDSLDGYVTIQVVLLKAAVPGLVVDDLGSVKLGALDAGQLRYTLAANGEEREVLQTIAMDTSSNRGYFITYSASPQNFGKYRRQAEAFVEQFSITGAAAPAPEPEEPAVVASADLVGRWRAYSESIYYDSGGSNYLDTPSTRVLELEPSGIWRLGSSSGIWGEEAITDADWERWGIGSYGPARRIVLGQWDGGTAVNGAADGPIDETESQVDFLWVIYRAEPPTVSSAGTIWIKYGRASG